MTGFTRNREQQFTLLAKSDGAASPVPGPRMATVYLSSGKGRGSGSPTGSQSFSEKNGTE